MKRIVIFLSLFTWIILIGHSQMVDNSLGRDLARIFPELVDGYIDLNGNGRLDELDDIDERIPETAVKDSVIQVQEILDFMLEYYPYLPLDKILAVQSALEGAEGAIPEIISLSWKTRIRDIVSLRRKMGADTVLLTPTALREAHATMLEYLATMALSYKKEGRGDERTFIQARDSLFSMLEKGYPLPETLQTDNKEILTNTLIHTVGNAGRGPDPTVKAAVRALGSLKAEESVPYILELMKDDAYRLACIEALGNLGNDTAVQVLRDIAESAPPEETRDAALRALGRIGGEESANLLLGYARATDSDAFDSADDAFADAFAKVAEGGTLDRRISAILTEYAESESTDLRKTAIRGLGYFDTPENAQNLLNKLKTENSEDVKIQIIRALNRLNHNAVIPTLLAELQKEGLSPVLQKEILSSLGANPDSVRAATQILTYLGSPDRGVRSAARQALLSLYRADPVTISKILYRGSMTAKDEASLKEITGIMAETADPDTLAALTNLIQNPSAEVKKNITWALYRIAPQDNVRLAGELAKLVTGESEALEVRINAVRALGAMQTDAPNLNIWQTLLTTAKMRGDKYLMLRFYAVQALGELAQKQAEISETLAVIALRETDRELKLQALRSLRKVLYPTAVMEETLLSILRQSESGEVKVSVVEILGDLGSDSAVDSAVRSFAAETDISRKRRILYALSRVGSRDALSSILDAAVDPELSEFVLGTLEDSDPDILSSLVSDRLKVEDRPEVISVLERLKTRLEERF